MNKPLPPIKAKFSINHEQLYLCAEIAFYAGEMKGREYFPSDEDKIEGVLPLLSLSSFHLTPSQYRGLARGESIEKIPLADSLARLYRRLPKLNPFELAFLKEFEAAYFPDGTPTRLGRKAEDCPYSLPLPSKIEAYAKALFSFLDASRKKTHPLLLSGMAAAEILAIAPYSDKNLALALFLAKAILVSYSKDFAFLPLERQYLRKKAEMDEVYARCAEKADLAEYVLSFLRLLFSCLISFYRKKTETRKASSKQVERLLEAMEEKKEYSASDLLSLLHLKSRLALMKNYITPALKSGLIKRSDPNNPTSRNQRYHKG